MGLRLILLGVTFLLAQGGSGQQISNDCMDKYRLYRGNSTFRDNSNNIGPMHMNQLINISDPQVGPHLTIRAFPTGGPVVSRIQFILYKRNLNNNEYEEVVEHNEYLGRPFFFPGEQNVNISSFWTFTVGDYRLDLEAYLANGLVRAQCEGESISFVVVDSSSTYRPTAAPTISPVVEPPSSFPTSTPSTSPTIFPTYVPTSPPSTISPTTVPTTFPKTTESPTLVPTVLPTISSPTLNPTSKLDPSAPPTESEITTPPPYFGGLPPNQDSSNVDGGSPIAIIAGAVAGGLVLLVILLICYCVTKRNRKSDDSTDLPSSVLNPTVGMVMNTAFKGAPSQTSAESGVPTSNLPKEHSYEYGTAVNELSMAPQAGPNAPQYESPPGEVHYETVPDEVQYESMTGDASTSATAGQYPPTNEYETVKDGDYASVKYWDPERDGYGTGARAAKPSIENEYDRPNQHSKSDGQGSQSQPFSHKFGYGIPQDKESSPIAEASAFGYGIPQSSKQDATCSESASTAVPVLDGHDYRKKPASESEPQPYASAQHIDDAPLTKNPQYENGVTFIEANVDYASPPVVKAGHDYRALSSDYRSGMVPTDAPPHAPPHAPPPTGPPPGPPPSIPIQMTSTSPNYAEVDYLDRSYATAEEGTATVSKPPVENLYAVADMEGPPEVDTNQNSGTLIYDTNRRPTFEPSDPNAAAAKELYAVPAKSGGGVDKTAMLPPGIVNSNNEPAYDDLKDISQEKAKSGTLIYDTNRRPTVDKDSDTLQAHAVYASPAKPRSSDSSNYDSQFQDQYSTPVPGNGAEPLYSEADDVL